jgi:hypothetical protein
MSDELRVFFCRSQMRAASDQALAYPTRGGGYPQPRSCVKLNTENAMPQDGTVPIDVGDLETWPEGLRLCVEGLCERYRDTAEYVAGLRLTDADERDLRANAGGFQVRAYHATRLLAHEVESIKRGGLQSLSLELVESRINIACQHSCINDDLRLALLSHHVLTAGAIENRLGSTCWFLPSSMLHEDAAGLWLLMTTWGGEAIYWHLVDTDVEFRLRELGTPSIVVANLNLYSGLREALVFPSLGNLLLGHRLGLKRVSGEIHLFASVPARDVEAIWQPGSAEYDAFPDLPRS